MISIRGHECELVTVKFIHPNNGKPSYQTVFQLFGKFYFASTAYRNDFIIKGWETMIFHTGQPVPEKPEDINPDLVTDWSGVFRMGYLQEPTQEWHEGTIKEFAERIIKQREGNVNG